MHLITRKNCLASILKKMQKLLPSEFGFFPETWVMPHEKFELEEFDKKKGKDEIYIVKPE